MVALIEACLFLQDGQAWLAHWLHSSSRQGIEGCLHGCLICHATCHRDQAVREGGGTRLARDRRADCAQCSACRHCVGACRAQQRRAGRPMRPFRPPPRRSRRRCCAGQQTRYVACATGAQPCGSCVPQALSWLPVLLLHSTPGSILCKVSADVTRKTSAAAA